jgi:DNA repair protein RecN (Recombination protein N)
MLLEFTITNFAIIDALHLRLDPHLNVFTGETGAGKSIIVDAISALVGERTGPEVVRAGADRAVVEGVFDVTALLSTTAPIAEIGGHGSDEGEEGAGGETLSAILAELGIEVEDGTLIISRELARTGRGIARVNGRAVPISALQRIAGVLIDIHGQSAHLTLLRPEQHVYYLDRYAGTEELRGEVAALVAEWRGARREYERLQRDEREVERRIELLRYQVDEIEAARLQPAELDDLERERKRLANAERLGELSAAAHAALSGDETGDTSGALDLLSTAQRTLSDLLRLDDSLHGQLDHLEQALYQLDDVAAQIRDYQDEVSADPARQAEVEERWDLLVRLRRKYGTTIEDILAFAAEASQELDDLTHREERAAELQEKEQELRRRIGALAGQLSLRRQAAAAELSAAMERELNELNMQRARFRVEFTHQPDPEGAPAQAEPPKGQRGAKQPAFEGTFAFTATGIDRVEFLIAPNPGEPFKPLAKIASGGETSRLMLALKTILSRADAVPILIFDEIDAGISGRSGQVVGEKLWQLGQVHQVLCVTHLPQISALGDCQYRVSKALRGDRTTTQVVALDAEERIEEIGQMLGGTATAKANAAELLARSEAWKRSTAASLRTA